jgi:hypothetical protein
MPAGRATMRPAAPRPPGTRLPYASPVAPGAAARLGHLLVTDAVHGDDPPADPVGTARTRETGPECPNRTSTPPMPPMTRGQNQVEAVANEKLNANPAGVR